MSILKKVADRYYNPKKSSGVNKRGTPYTTVLIVNIKKSKKGYYTTTWDIPYGRKYFKTIKALKDYSKTKTNIPIRFKEKGTSL